MTIPAIHPVRLSNSNIAFGVQAVFPSTIPCTVLPTLMWSTLQLKDAMMLDARAGEDICLEWMMVNTGRGMCTHGVSFHLQVRKSTDMLTLQTMQDQLEQLVKSHLDQLGLPYELVQLADQGTAKQLPASDVLFLRKAAHRGALEGASVARIHAPVYYYPYLQREITLPMQAIQQEIALTRNAGIVFRLMPTVFTTEERSAIQAGVDSRDTLTVYRTAYQQYHSMQQPFAFTGMLWGDCKKKIADLLLQTGLDLESFVPASMPQPLVGHEILHDPWALQQRQYARGTMGRMRMVTDLQEMSSLCHFKQIAMPEQAAMPADSADAAAMQYVQLPDPTISQLLSLMRRMGLDVSQLTHAISSLTESVRKPTDSGAVLKALGELRTSMDTLALNQQLLPTAEDFHQMLGQINQMITGQLQSIREEFSTRVKQIVVDSQKQIEETVVDSVTTAEKNLSDKLDKQQLLFTALQGELSALLNTVNQQILPSEPDAAQTETEQCITRCGDLLKDLQSAGLDLELHQSDYEALGAKNARELLQWGLTESELTHLQYGLMLLKLYEVFKNKEITAYQPPDIISFACPLLILYEGIASSVMSAMYKKAQQTFGWSMNEAEQDFAFYLRLRRHGKENKYTEHAEDRRRGDWRDIYYAELITLSGQSENDVAAKARNWVFWLNICNLLRLVRNKVHDGAGPLSEELFTFFLHAWLHPEEKSVTHKTRILSNAFIKAYNQCKSADAAPLSHAGVLYVPGPADDQRQSRLMAEASKNSSYYQRSTMQFLLDCRMKLTASQKEPLPVC